MFIITDTFSPMLYHAFMDFTQYIAIGFWPYGHSVDKLDLPEELQTMKSGKHAGIYLFWTWRLHYL